MVVRFVKMHGAGNDFVMVDARHVAIPQKAEIARLANRPDGIGCEGVIFVESSKRLDFKMRFFNPDGGEAELCGNGARCVAAFAYAIGAVKTSKMRFETLAGDIDAEVLSDSLVKIAMPPPKDLRHNFVNSGVPHAIVPVEALDEVDVSVKGRKIRYSDEFAPAGTNVDFVHFTLPSRVDIRTYERGVEAESFACGTGAVASAIVGVKEYGLAFPVKVVTKRGSELIIGGEYDGNEFRSITLTGPVQRVFEGELPL